MKIATHIFFAFLAMTFLTGCSKNDPSVNATRLRINLANASPANFQEFNVDIQKIEISTVDSTGGNESWATLDIEPSVHNITPLLSDKYKQIADQYFPMGVLRRIRITFGNNSGLRTYPTENPPTAAESISLVLDPAIQDGIIIDVNANMYANYISSILIDINSALSVYESNGNFFFRPVIRVFPETFGGALRGYASPIEAAPVVVIAKDNDTLLTLPEFTDGRFFFKGLPEGEWEINVLADPASGYKDTTFVDTVFTGRIRDLKSKIVLKR
ncbi:MAG: DUF4382 domain-containing protein [Bacteroidia bacterium]|nr:DUF4382 domain-containing protein [Bacteroidia bacterium]